ncbi:syntaxin 6 [Ceratobasidium sp. AG-Ba]|nr:syntaxin 6 [Ceratobasidium sp. AG-Ba]
MSVDPWHEVKNESTASANSEELNWARNELKGTLAALDADLEDLEESVRIVEESGGRLFGVEEEEVMARRKYVVHVRKQIESMRKEVNSGSSNTRSGTARLSPTADPEPREDDQAEWARLEQEVDTLQQLLQFSQYCQ